MAELVKWQNFHVIVGSSGAALIGMQFVVVTLIASMRLRVTVESIRAFSTPTVLHLGSAVVISAIMSAPWPSLLPLALALAACSLAGLGYQAVAIRCLRRQTIYKPVWDDWLCYAVLPCGAYAALALAALLLGAMTQLALFITGGSALGLLLIGIHNAWDTVTHIIIVAGPRDDATKTGASREEHHADA